MEKQKKSQNKLLQSKALNSSEIHIDLTEELGLNIPKDNTYIIPIFIPHKGCNNNCVFCNQKKISGETRDVTAKQVKEEIEYYLKLYKDGNRDKQIAFFGGSFTGLDIAEQNIYLDVAHNYIKEGKVRDIRISTRPDYINEDILENLKKFNVRVIELGVQSMSDDVLMAAKRGHKASDVEKASKLITKNKFILGHQLMVGLPNSSLEKEIYSVRESIKLSPKIIRIYPVYVLRDSELWEMMTSGEYIPMALNDSIMRAKVMYQECIKSNINVIRIGLQTTSEINDKNTNIKGPVINNYKERILSLIAREQVLEKLNHIESIDTLKIYCPKVQVNYIVGANKENIRFYESMINGNVKVISE